MEGLLIAEQLQRITPQLPAERLSWRFPDVHTFVLPLSKSALWLYNRPPDATLEVSPDFPPVGATHSGFQDLLVSRAVGRLERIEQLKLDRVVKFYFTAAKGFVNVEPAVLIAELTGRNCNLILTDPEGMILGVAREVTKDINRFRQLRSGLRYVPPPPYEKLDPRTATLAELEHTLSGQPLKDLNKLLDGIGPDLLKTLLTHLKLPRSHRLEPDDVTRLEPLLRELSREPSRIMQAALGLPDIETLREQGELETKRERVQEAITRQKSLVEKRLRDIEETRIAATEAESMRMQADVLLAFAKDVPSKASEVTLTDFEGQPLHLTLDPRLDVFSNAQTLYDKVKKRQARKVQAETREGELFEELEGLETLVASLESLSVKELEHLAETYVPKAKTQYRAEPGMRFTSPQGYGILVGRNSRDNDTVTFKLAKSRDVWLHVQGYTGSHVIIQADNREVPFEVILFAAQLAAAYSKAGESDNVPIDYTLRKNVWKPKGAPPGAVHYAQQKTVYVTPSRRPEG